MAAREYPLEDDSSAVVIDLTRDGLLIDAAPEMQVPFVDLGSEHAPYRHQIDAAVARVIDESSFVLGEDVAAFEQDFAAYCGTAHAVGVDSGFSALELMLRAFGIGAGDEVITTANTFVATAAAIDAAGARPVLVDADPVTRSMTADNLEAAITPRTRAIIPVHLFGRVVPMDDIREVADRHGLVVLEDACQAHGARYRGRRVGSLGHAAAFSFYPSKNLGALGDGGMVTTDDAEMAGRLRMLRNVGSSQKYVHEIRGFNRRLDTVHAAALRVKLRHLDTANDRRRDAAAAYSALLADLPLHLPAPAAFGSHVYHLYVVESAQREGLQEHLTSRGVATGIHYPIPIHLQPGYRWLGYSEGDFPVSERLAREMLSLPMFPTIDMSQIAYVVEAMVDHFNRVGAWT
ncbi:MAG: DegT/DnrJ/EryC1/StrS family aminotransferase [Actinomycetota bacterium]